MSKRPVPKKSIEREVGADNIRAFSSFDDFLSYYIEKGDVTSLENLLEEHPQLLGTILFEWYRQGQVACVFAQKLARDFTNARWESVVVPAQTTGAALTSLLDPIAASLEAIQIIFPGVTTARNVADLICALCAHPSWRCVEVPWILEEKGRSLQVGIRWTGENGGYTSWALGIAPFAPMPFTRRFFQAPFTALVLRPSPPTEFITQQSVI